MTGYKDIKISTGYMNRIIADVKDHEGDNPACCLGHYWKDRMGPKMLEILKHDNKVPYGFVGDGWPIESNQDEALKHDKLKISNAYDHVDCRDKGDAIYQSNLLIPYLTKRKVESEYREKFFIVDIGAGYGRLAIPFIKAMKNWITYIGVDYSPIGLLTSCQFVRQMCPDAWVLSWDMLGDFARYDYVSLPAWRLNELKAYPIDIFISVHSFQEMERKTVNYYVELMAHWAWMEPLFYSVNIWPEDQYVRSHWELLFDRPYPINRDGSFNEKLWKIKR